MHIGCPQAAPFGGCSPICKLFNAYPSAHPIAAGGAGPPEGDWGFCGPNPEGAWGLVRPKLRESEGRSARTFPPTFPPLYPNRLRNRKARQRDITVFIGLLG